MLLIFLAVKAEASPHAGKERSGHNDRTTADGSIPARGEGTFHLAELVAQFRKHPRTRGRNPGHHGDLSAVFEASPHAGKELWVCAGAFGAQGSIPARGEGTAHTRSFCFCRSKHPRTRGRNLLALHALPALVEASPHAGKELAEALGVHAKWRSIPARGEGTVLDVADGDRKPKHPRTRGRNPCARDG